MKVCGENIIVGYGEENVDFSRIISLNESAALLWEAVKDTEFTAETLADKLCEEYEVDNDTALNDAQSIIDRWQEAGLLEPVA